MAFDWIQFFDQYHIEYVTDGPNVSKGNVAIHCPFCGHNDPSHHLGVSVDGKGWGCWRDNTHRGKNPVRLIAALLGCTREQAKKIAGQNVYIPADFYGSVTQLLNPKGSETIKQKSLKMPIEFKPFLRVPSARLYTSYLIARGYTHKQIDLFTDLYGIRYCREGSFRGRIIFPVYHKGRLVTWTGRSVHTSAVVRYKTLSADHDKAQEEGYKPSVGMINDYLLWYDDLKKGPKNTLLLVEGPFDALRVRVLGEKYGIVATCFFTSAPSQEQIGLLREVLPLFKRKFLLLDRGTLPKVLYLKSMLESLDVDFLTLPDGVDDPGELARDQLFALCER